jgi:transcriptional regulator
MPSPFEQWKNEDVVRLIREHPMAWVVPKNQDAFPVLLPMLVECGADGAPASLLGHVPKHNPLAGTLLKDGAARFLFLGPHAYISPESMSDKDWAPTWNYASAQLDCVVDLDDRLTEEALEKLVSHMEEGRAQQWSVAMLGARYGKLRSQVIGFRARIVGMRARFKLGQDESETAFGEILEGLGDGDLADWMRRFREQR